jgi:hypothetical protein
VYTRKPAPATLSVDWLGHVVGGTEDESRSERITHSPARDNTTPASSAARSPFLAARDRQLGAGKATGKPTSSSDKDADMG